MCPYCRSKSVEYIENVHSGINGKEYSLYQCRNCLIQFFTPLIFENIYETEKAGLYTNFHLGRTAVPSWSKKTAELIKRLFPDLTRINIMDIGAGDGINYQSLTAIGLPTERYHLIELDKKSVASAVKRGVSTNNITVGYFTPGLYSKKLKFDIVIATEVLEHQIDPKNFLQACFNLLKPRGFLIISVPNRTRFFLKQRSITEDIPPHHFLRFNINFFLKNFKDRLVFINMYHQGFSNISVGAKALSKQLNLSTGYWMVCLLPVIILRAFDYIRGVGIIVVLKK